MKPVGHITPRPTYHNGARSVKEKLVIHGGFVSERVAVRDDHATKASADGWTHELAIPGGPGSGSVLRSMSHEESTPEEQAARDHPQPEHGGRQGSLGFRGGFNSHRDAADGRSDSKQEEPASGTR